MVLTLRAASALLLCATLASPSSLLAQPAQEAARQDAAEPGQPVAAPDGAAPDGSAANGEAPMPRADVELTPPKLIEDVQPVYPEAAREAGLAAEVTLDIDIDATGVVEGAVVTVPAEPPGQGFDEAALEAAKRLRFEPAHVGEQAVPVRISYRFRFVPDVGPQPEPAAAGDTPVAPPPPPTGELWGRLQQRGTRLPIEGVKVTAFRGDGETAEGFETETDGEGSFRFEGLGVGDWRLLADPVGYYPLRATETVATDERTDVRYVIEKRSYNRYDVVVEGQRVRREVNRTTIDARQAERVPGTFGDVLAVVQNFPGVARADFGEIVVRGSDPDDTQIFIEGVSVPSLYHFGGLRGVLPVGMIERIEFYPGNFSVEYGRAIGGVIDVDLRELAPEKIGGYADLSFLDASVYLEAPVTEDLALAVGFRRSWIDAILAAVLPEGSGVITAPRYYDFQALASYRPDPAHHAEVFFFLSDDRFELLFEEPISDGPGLVVSDVNYAVNFHGTTAKYRYVPNKQFDNEVSVTYGQNNLDFNLGESLFAHATLDQLQMRDTARYALSEGFAVRTGVDYIFQEVDWSLRLPLPSRDDDEMDGPPPNEDEFIFTELQGSHHSTAVFLELEVNPYESLLLVPGVRLDHFSRTEELAVSPRVTARQELTEQWALKGGVGLFVQEPGFDQTDTGLGNPDLGLKKAIHYSTGVEYQPLEHITLDVTGFYKTMYDLVSGTDEVVERDGETVPAIYNNGGEGRAYGLEVSARHELADGLFGWVAYTLSRAERKQADESAFRLFEYDQTHILTVIGSYKLPRNWEVGARFRLVSGSLYTPITGAIYDADADKYRGIRGPLNSGRVGAFHQLDVRIDKRWIYESWMLGAYLDVQNVYNRKNPEGLGYNYDFSETEVTSGLPIIPVLGLRGEF